MVQTEQASSIKLLLYSLSRALLGKFYFSNAGQKSLSNAVAYTRAETTGNNSDWNIVVQGVVFQDNLSAFFTVTLVNLRLRNGY